MEITTYKQAIKVLRKKGTKVTLQTKADSVFIYAEKTDFITTLKDRIENGCDSFTNYDGDADPVHFSDNVLHVQAGSF